jgi:antitoxin CptB
MTGLARTSAGLDERRRRLLFRSWRRGTREMDLIMGRFAESVIADLTDEDIVAFERISDVADPDLYAWLTGKESVPADHDSPVFRRLRDFFSLRPME